MARLKGINQGPSRTIEVLTPVVCGTTSGYTEVAALGPLICIEDTTFESDCVMVGGSSYAPSTSKTYGAGQIIYKYFTTIHLASGSVEAMELKSIPQFEG